MRKRSSYNRYSYVNSRKIKNLQKVMNLLAYGSLFLDICIAIVTTFSLMNINTGEFMLVPIHYMLTSVVVMSLVSGGMLLYIKHYERVMAELLRIKYKIKITWIPSPKTRYGFRWNLRKKLRSIFNF